MFNLVRLRIAAMLCALTAGVAAGTSVAIHDWARLREVAQMRYGQGGLSAVSDWQQMINLARTEPVAVKLSRVNEFFNYRTRFEDDIAAWSQDDYWATPLETLTRGRGDCEDFAIAKYVSLMELGVPAMIVWAVSSSGTVTISSTCSGLRTSTCAARGSRPARCSSAVPCSRFCALRLPMAMRKPLKEKPLMALSGLAQRLLPGCSKARRSPPGERRVHTTLWWRFPQFDKSSGLA